MKICNWNSKLLVDLVKSSARFKICGLDIGTKKVGIAITDESRTFVAPYKLDISRKEPRMSKESVQAFSLVFSQFLCSEACKAVIIGLPLHNGKLTPLCDEFIRLIASTNLTLDSRTPEPLCAFVDEYGSTSRAREISRLTTQGSKISLFQRQRDGLAAALILESFLKTVREID
jgi:RNase H-fold protein (predicted Holliday junction resolvase)